MSGRKSFFLLLGLLACVGCSRQKSTDQLIQDLDSSQEKDRIVAVRLLGIRDQEPTKVVPALIKALKGKEVDVRLSAAIGLGYFGDQAKDAVPALQEAQKDRDPRVREAAGVALSRIDPERFTYSPPAKKQGKSSVKVSGEQVR
jgi:HEAT repeat protein